MSKKSKQRMAQGTDDQVVLPMTVLVRILGYSDVVTVARSHCISRGVYAYLSKMGAKESDALWTSAVFHSVKSAGDYDSKRKDPFWSDGVLLRRPDHAHTSKRTNSNTESTLQRLKLRLEWERRLSGAHKAPVATTGNARTAATTAPGMRHVLAPVSNLSASILAAMKAAKAGLPTQNHPRSILAINDSFAYLGAMKQIHTHQVATVEMISDRSISVTPSTHLLFLQNTQPRNLQVTNLINYSRVSILLTPKKPFLFRILNWTHTPLIYFVDRDTYQRRMWFYDADINSLLPVVGVVGLETLDAANNADADEADDANILTTDGTMIDPFAAVVNVSDASVNDQMVGFGNTVVWWTWVGGNDEEGEEDDIAAVDEEERGPRQLELKIHAYEVVKDSFVEGLGVKVKVTKLWEHTLFLTSSQNVSAMLIPHNGGRFHLHHHKKYLPKVDAEIVSVYVFDLVQNGGLLLDESIIEEPPVHEDDPSVLINMSQPTIGFPRTLIGARANNLRILTRFHMLEFHEDNEMLGFPKGPLKNLDPEQVREIFARAAAAAALDDEKDDPMGRDLNVSLYPVPEAFEAFETVRDPSLGIRVEVSSTVNQSASSQPLLSLVPAVKNMWRPSKRQVSEDGALLVVAGIEGARRCLRIVDVSCGDASAGTVRCFYLDDEMGVLGPRRKRVGGGVWMVEKVIGDNIDGCGWKVFFLECGGVQ
ncbi:hypothetical protein CcCBS67573_g00346 [Chytriomyces confervae]|uniref:Uncharacterized protein n=1 Tax=Chytriomyces confervae TaxID=246404 RepID=A0A507FPK1_9FUNG|nr:hypothetical protein HDU80_006781 [Chytriomyces hyalinus]TPX78349.1 hypothetical protein CcCBS67573_g00346 [Chytriomyces confervae]